MPELPEVETIVRLLAPRLAGRRLVEARFFAARVLRGAAEPELAGHTVERVERHGKNILLRFDHGTLAVHLGMTGKLLLDGELSPYLRASFLFEGVTLLYDDIRQFGRMRWEAGEAGLAARLGPDALSLEEGTFTAMLCMRRSRIKPLLLNQGFVSGMGNIYTDEALFRAGIHPLTMANDLSRRRAGLLYRAMVDVLTESIASGGSSISDYVDTEGRRGSFQERHLVYGREGEACPRCGGEIRRIVVGQRGTHYCAVCQKR